MKHLKFTLLASLVTLFGLEACNKLDPKPAPEDIRLPYVGTYTVIKDSFRIDGANRVRKIISSGFEQVLPVTDTVVVGYDTAFSVTNPGYFDLNFNLRLPNKLRNAANGLNILADSVLNRQALIESATLPALKADGKLDSAKRNTVILQGRLTDFSKWLGPKAVNGSYYRAKDSMLFVAVTGFWDQYKNKVNTTTPDTIFRRPFTYFIKAKKRK